MAKTARLGVERRDVAERVDGQTPAWDLHVGLPGLLFQLAVARLHREAQSIRGVVPAQLVLQRGEIGVVPDAHALDAEHAGQIDSRSAPVTAWLNEVWCAPPASSQA